jgi:protein-L-isoaspartate(D-aspartate) O-methyltransferase
VVVNSPKKFIRGILRLAHSSKRASWRLLVCVPLITVVLLLLGDPSYCFCQNGDREHYQELRYKMVATQIAARGVKDERVLQAMRDVPRHFFVPPKSRRSAYGDYPLPIGYGQTISQPYIVAFMTELLAPHEDHVALEVGTGSGYQAAILSEIVKEVYTIEIIPPLGKAAEKRLKELAYEKVTVKVGDGYYGWEEHAPFDCIIVTAASDHIPPPLIKQLKKGGKMAIPVGHPFQVQHLMLVEKLDGGEVRTRSVLPVRFVPFRRKWE